jgi:hypothetical protein
VTRRRSSTFQQCWKTAVPVFVLFASLPVDPGLMQLMRNPWGVYSAAAQRIMPTTACLEAE